jgi:predicted GTPase
MALLGQLDAVIFLVDLDKEPLKQVSDILIDILGKRGIPVIIAANKIDLMKGKAPDVEYDFLGHPVVPISALKGTNMNRLYMAVYKRLRK